MRASDHDSQRQLLGASFVNFLSHGATHSDAAQAAADEAAARGIPVATAVDEFTAILNALRAADRVAHDRHVQSEARHEERATHATADRAQWGQKTLGAIQNMLSHVQSGFQSADRKMTRHHRETTRMMAAQDMNLTERMSKLNDTLGKAGLVLLGLQLFGMANLRKLWKRPKKDKFKSREDLEDGGAGLNRRELESLLQKMNKLHMAMHVQNHELNELKRLVKAQA